MLMVWMMLSSESSVCQDRLPPTLRRTCTGVSVLKPQWLQSTIHIHHPKATWLLTPTFINPTIHLLSHTIFTRSPAEHVLYLEAMWPRLLFPHLLNEWTQEGIKILRSPSHQDDLEQPGSKTWKMLKKNEKETQMHCHKIIFHWKGEKCKNTLNPFRAIV